MDEAIQTHLKSLEDAVQATAIPADRKQTALWCIRQLPALYTLSCQTGEGRHDDEITRLVQGLMQQLTTDGATCPESQKLAAGIPDGFRRLHQRLGLSFLSLKLPAPLPSPRKARKSDEKKQRTTQGRSEKAADAGEDPPPQVRAVAAVSKSSAKTFQNREKELQALLATPAGRKKLEELSARYQESGGRVRPANTSVVTYILVHERDRGLIVG